jgi:hypothetical protein
LASAAASLVGIELISSFFDVLGLTSVISSAFASATVSLFFVAAAAASIVVLVSVVSLLISFLSKLISHFFVNLSHLLWASIVFLFSLFPAALHVVEHVFDQELNSLSWPLFAVNFEFIVNCLELISNFLFLGVLLTFLDFLVNQVADLGNQDCCSLKGIILPKSCDKATYIDESQLSSILVFNGHQEFEY